MLIIQMLMKRAMTGVLPLIAAAKKLADEILAGPSFDEGPKGDFAAEQQSVAQAKKAFLLASGAAVQKFGDKLAEQEEVVGALANIVIDIYAMESSLLRAEKAAEAKSTSASLMADAARAYIYDVTDRVEKEARTALAGVEEGDSLATQLAVLRRFTKHSPVNVIALRRRVAESVLSQQKYPFEGR